MKKSSLIKLVQGLEKLRWNHEICYLVETKPRWRQCSVALAVNDTWYGRKNQNYRKIATYIRYTTQT